MSIIYRAERVGGGGGGRGSFSWGVSTSERYCSAQAEARIPRTATCTNGWEVAYFPRVMWYPLQ